MNTNYTLLFRFENEETIIIEIKINGIDSHDKSKIYHWLFLSSEKKDIRSLTFKGMGVIEDKEFRDFEDSRLVFNNSQALFTDKNGSQRLTVMCANNGLDTSAKESIDQYIKNLKY